MKRRAQLPNAQTFTILFNGFANSNHPKLAVAEATRIYMTMLNSRLPPNTIHMNAVLKVCSRARDLESMFNIVETASKTTRAPDQHTYTTVLNALPLMPSGDPKSAAEKQMRAAQVITAIARSKAIWEEVVSKWRSGLIVIDEQLVCAMAKVLAVGTRPNSREILALLEQTMDIPRLDLKPAVAIKKAGGVALETKDAPEPAAGEPDEGQEGKHEGSRGHETALAPVSNPGLFARPGTFTLSVLLKALRRIKRHDLAVPYWEALTERGVVPDADNWYWLLIVLRAGRNSALTVKMLQKMPVEMRLPKTFQFAMQTCLDCAADHDTFGHAGQVLDLMLRDLRTPDPFTLRIYLRVADKSDRPFVQRAAAGDPEGAKFAQGRQLLRAMDRTWEPTRTLANSTQYPPVDATRHSRQLYNEEREAQAVIRLVVGLADRVVSQSMATDDMIKVTRLRRDQLNRQIRRFWRDRQFREPKLFKQHRPEQRPPSQRWDERFYEESVWKGTEETEDDAAVAGAEGEVYNPLRPSATTLRGDEYILQRGRASAGRRVRRPAAPRGEEDLRADADAWHNRRDKATSGRRPPAKVQPQEEEDDDFAGSVASSSQQDTAAAGRRPPSKSRTPETEDDAFSRAFTATKAL